MAMIAHENFLNIVRQMRVTLAAVQMLRTFLGNRRIERRIHWNQPNFTLISHNYPDTGLQNGKKLHQRTSDFSISKI